MVAAQEETLRFREKIGYGLGDTASNFYFQTFAIFLLYYYTNVDGLSAAAVGTMSFVSKRWDAVNDPSMGVIAGRTNTRHGKFRPYLCPVLVHVRELEGTGQGLAGGKMSA